MIKDRNIAKDAGIQISKIIGAGLLGRAKIFYAAKASGDWAAEMQPRIDNNYYFDQSDSIQQAIYATVSGRGDVVIVGPGKRTESSIVGSETAGSNKSALKIIAAQHGWETQCRASDAGTKQGAYTPTGGSATNGFFFVVVSRGIEIAGFLMDGGGGYGGVYLGDGYNAISSSWNENTSSGWIHDCTFRGGNEGTYGVVLDGCSADVTVENNKFMQNTAAGLYMTPGGGRTVQRPVIRNNVFVADNGSYGIDMYSSATTIGAQIIGNTFADTASHAFTYGVRLQNTGAHTLAGNYFACANKWSGSSTDFISGNYKANGADGSEGVSES